MKRNKFTIEFKAKVAIEAISCTSTIQQLAQKYGVHPNQISLWKSAVIGNAANLFERGDKSLKEKEGCENERLYAQIGQMKVENDFLKKKHLQIYGHEFHL